jgi:hypothetical protein
MLLAEIAAFSLKVLQALDDVIWSDLLSQTIPPVVFGLWEAMLDAHAVAGRSCQLGDVGVVKFRVSHGVALDHAG